MENLIEATIRIGVKSAKMWYETQGRTFEITDAFCDCLKANIKIRMPKALADAKEALEVGMNEIAEQTFAAEIALAGIDAAKECA